MKFFDAFKMFFKKLRRGQLLGCPLWLRACAEVAKVAVFAECENGFCGCAV